VRSEVNVAVLCLDGTIGLREAVIGAGENNFGSPWTVRN